MSAYHAGISNIRCHEHDRADEFDAIARHVLHVMAWFAGGDEPEYWGSRATIAHYARLSGRAVDGALLRLEKLGAIERVGRKGKTVRWRLTLLCARDAHKRADDNTAPGAHKNTAPGAHKNTAPGAHNPSDPSDPKGGREEDRSHPSADAPGRATSTADAGPSKLITQIMAIRGGSAEDNQRWADRELAAATQPIKSVPRFLVWKARDEVAAIESAPAKPSTKKAPTKTVSAKRASPPPAGRPTAAKRSPATRPAKAAAPLPRLDCIVCGRTYRAGTPGEKAYLCPGCRGVPSRSETPRCRACGVVHADRDNPPKSGLCAQCEAGRIFNGKCTRHGVVVAPGQTCSADGCTVSRAEYRARHCVDCGNLEHQAHARNCRWA